MLFELSVIPLGYERISGPVSEALKIIDASGLPYRLGPTGTCVEGTWDEVMPVLRRCHERVRELSPHVVSMIKIDDEAGVTGKLQGNVQSVEAKVGRPLGRS